MAIPLHLWLKDIDGSDIRGSSQVAGREGSIEVLGFKHGMHSSTDSVTGRLLGARLHLPIVIEKEIDRSSPILYMRLARGDTLKSAEIKWYRVDEAGREVEYFNMMLRDVKIVAVSPEVPNIKDAPAQVHNHTEKLSLRYEDITWTYLDGNLQYRDTWSS